MVVKFVSVFYCVEISAVLIGITASAMVFKTPHVKLVNGVSGSVF